MPRFRENARKLLPRRPSGGNASTGFANSEALIALAMLARGGLPPITAGTSRITNPRISQESPSKVMAEHLLPPDRQRELGREIRPSGGSPTEARLVELSQQRVGVGLEPNGRPDHFPGTDATLRTISLIQAQHLANLREICS